MSHSFLFQNKEFSLERYPKTSNRSLLPISNVELLVLKEIEARNEIDHIHIFNDRFGVWNCALNDKNVTTIWNYASQKKAVAQNLKRNGFSMEEKNFKNPLEKLDSVDLALIRIPKSVELFELFLHQIHQYSTKNTEVICGFMTKYFNASLLKVAEQYFEDVSQSLAWKKARLLILKKPKRKTENKRLVNSISWKDSNLQQYFGVFSSGKIDIGTQFLIEHMGIREEDKEVLDLASGNGILAHEVLQMNSETHVTLIDDSILAIESSKLNIEKSSRFVCDNDLSQFSSNQFDLVLSNPPFHFEYENNIEVSIHLFKQVVSCLKPKGRFVLVANKHLNYSTHLKKLFDSVSQLKANDKFEILECKIDS